MAHVPQLSCIPHLPQSTHKNFNGMTIDHSANNNKDKVSLGGCSIIGWETDSIGNKIDSQLDEQARIFLNDPSRNTITASKVEVSKIFSWFGGDFCFC